MKQTTAYVCSSCAASFSKWAGRCSECGSWNTLEEVKAASATATADRVEAVSLREIPADPKQRTASGSQELDRVLGGGLVRGSIVLLGGEPGIGKSTLLMQVAGFVGKQQGVVYVSGEESGSQLSGRAQRLGVTDSNVKVVSSTDVDRIVRTVLDEKADIVIVDSIQTIQTTQFSSGPGSVTQVRESAARLQAVAKSHNITIILVGHVTKDGQVAGPKVLEHLVDVVVYLEGERYQEHRLLRGVKNRFGQTDEVGVFTMSADGLRDEAQPSKAFIDDSTVPKVGTALAATLEGSRVLLVEVQALGVETVFGYPKRTASGIDQNKLALIIAILTKHAGLSLSSQDIYANVAGGFRLADPGADLGIAAAIAAAARNVAFPERTVFIGELGLSGEVRRVPNLERRLQEAARGGIATVFVPQGSKIPAIDGLRVQKIGNVGMLRSLLSSKEVAHAA
jgi:DNA repair protein RadA/Sms